MDIATYVQKPSRSHNGEGAALFALALLFRAAIVLALGGVAPGIGVTLGGPGDGMAFAIRPGGAYRWKRVDGSKINDPRGTERRHEDSAFARPPDQRPLAGYYNGFKLRGVVLRYQYVALARQ